MTAIAAVTVLAQGDNVTPVLGKRDGPDLGADQDGSEEPDSEMKRTRPE